MRANLYIGLGGSGVKTVDLIKQHVSSSDNSHNATSAFLAIDTDMISLDNCKSISLREFVNINIEFPYARYISDKERYDIPDKNINALRDLSSCGSGQSVLTDTFVFFSTKTS